MMRPAQTHLAPIDALRGVAVLLVVGYHLFGGIFGRMHLDWRGDFPDVRSAPNVWFLVLYPLSFGGAGVPLFFVLSGYVIHRSYLLDRQFGWRRYAARRFWRIYPAYLVALIGFAAWAGVPPLSWQFLSHLALVHNVTDTTYFGIVPAFWSLAVEVQLYALYPIALAVRRRLGVGGMLAAGYLVSAAWRATAAALVDWSAPPSMAVWGGPVPLWPDWLLGAYLAERHLNGQRVFARPLAWAAGFVILALAAASFRPTTVLFFSVTAAAAAGLVEWAVVGRRIGGPGWVVLSVVGLCSYSIYLTHQPLVGYYVQFSYQALGPAGIVAAPAFALVAIAVGWLLYVTVERWGIRLGRRLSACGSVR